MDTAELVFNVILIVIFCFAMVYLIVWNKKENKKYIEEMIEIEKRLDEMKEEFEAYLKVNE